MLVLDASSSGDLTLTKNIKGGHHIKIGSHQSLSFRFCARQEKTLVLLFTSSKITPAKTTTQLGNTGNIDCHLVITLLGITN
jgi:hypothetical protein